MAQMPNHDVLTNDADRPDLLQQALQPVIDDDEQQNEYIFTLIQTDKGVVDQVVRVIPEAKISKMNVNKEVIFLPYKDNTINANIPVNINMKDYIATQQEQHKSSWSPQEPFTVTQINFVPTEVQDPIIDSVTIGNNSQEWQIQNLSQSESLQKLMLDTDTLYLNPVDLDGEYSQYKINNEITDQPNDTVQQNCSIGNIKGSKLQKIKIDKDNTRISKHSYCVRKVLAQKNQIDTNHTNHVIQEQILQKLPKILPSSTQNVVEVAQSILQTNQNGNASKNLIKTFPTIISNQVVNRPKILTYARNMANETVFTPCFSTNVMNNSTNSINYTTKQIHSSSANNGNSKTTYTDLWKPIQVSSQILNVPTTIATTIENKASSELSTIITNPKSPTFKNIRTIKLPNQKSVKTNPRSILKSAQNISIPISVLKSEGKIVSNVNNVSNQNSTITSKNENKSAKGLPSTSTNGLKQSSSQNVINVVQNGTNLATTQPLSDVQLKQVRQILEQHNPNTETKDRMVFYRIVSLEDVGIKNPEKNRAAKRGRPKKNTIQTPVLQSSATVENEYEEIKDKQMKVAARTRSGRLSRPPRYMISDYKRLPFDKNLTCMQTDPDDSDGGYNEYMNSNKPENQESPVVLLNGLEVPKRNISDRFKCPKCNKCYLGRSRMLSHFEKHPDHGSPEQLSLTTEPKQNVQDPLKRKGKKRGPWAYATPEAKAQRRQEKLEEAMNACKHEEVIKIIEKILDTQSLFDLLALKFGRNIKNFLEHAKHFGDQMREKIRTALTIANTDEKNGEDVIDFKDEPLGAYLGIHPGTYRINNRTVKMKELPISDIYDEPSPKIRKVDSNENTKENNEEQMSSGGSETSELSVMEFLNENKNNLKTNSCSDVLSTLTLTPRSPNFANNIENGISNNTSNVLISSSEIQTQISDNPGFQKVDITTSKLLNFEKPNSRNDTFINLSDSVDISNSIQSFHNVDNYEQSSLEQAFGRLEPVNRTTFDSVVNSYQKQDTLTNLEEIRNELDNIETGSQSFQNVESITPALSSIETRTPIHSEKIILSTSVDKILPNIPMLGETVQDISSNCDVFESNENLDMSKMTDYLFTNISDTNGEIDKNLSIDDSANLSSVNVPNIGDIVPERFQNVIMTDNVLENNLSDNTNTYADLNFEVLTTDFNESTCT